MDNLYQATITLTFRATSPEHAYDKFCDLLTVPSVMEAADIVETDVIPTEGVIEA